MDFLKLLPSCMVAVLHSPLVHAAVQQHDEQLAATYNLKKLSVEELLSVEVTSVSRSRETLGSAAAAVTVVSADDIRRSGATTVPEALRGVPGLHVAQQNASAWAVSSRGFSGVNSEKLLVLSDTRSIYTPLYSGVFWDVQDYLLEDIDRIEVIRGPGAALWGANAVNGVININTKQARDTQGGYVEALAGSEERLTVGARYGSQLGDDAHYRVFVKHFDRDSSFNAVSSSDDAWRMTHLGFRGDWDASEGDSFTLQGDIYRGDIGLLQPTITVIGRQGPQGRLRTDVNGGNVLGRWRRTLAEDSDLQLRVYYDRTHRDDPSFRDDLDTVDADFQHRFAPTGNQEVIWGFNYRYMANRNDGKGIFAVRPASSTDELFSGFIQDQISFGALRITLGTKLEHNDFSGWEVQPSVRAVWSFTPTHSLWSAASRAVRTPTRLERDIYVDVTDPNGDPVARLLGSDEFESETLLAYEAGYRWQPLAQLSFDLAAFHNRYHGLSSLEFGDVFIDPLDGRTVFPIVNRNLTDGVAQGIEASMTFAPLQTWRLTASYSNVDLSLDPRGEDLNRGRFLEGSTPRHQAALRSSLDLSAGIEFDAQLRYLSSIRSLPDIVEGGGLGGYAELDVRIAWLISPRVEASLVGRNLLHERHAEFGPVEARGELERSAYGKITWKF